MEDLTMPMKKQAVRISSVRSATKGSVKAKKVVSVSYGYGSSRKSGHGSGNGTKHGYGHKAKYGSGHKTKQGYGQKKSNGCGHKAGYGHSQDSGYGHGAGSGHGSGHETGYGSSKKKSGYGYKKQSLSKPVYKPSYKKTVCKPVCKPECKPICKPVRRPVCKPVNKFGKNRFRKVLRRSGFRANASVAQPVAAGTLTQVNFNQQVIDLGNEYNPATSTFTARHSGIYTFFASVLFTATGAAGPVPVALLVQVNGADEFGDSETFADGSGFIDASGVVKLQRGDNVRVQFLTEVAGTINASVTTHFDGTLNRFTN
jgi:hypothetical protein